MTFAPSDLLMVQGFAHRWTDQPWESLGIIHSTPMGGGYHEGEDLLIAADRAPGPQYPYTDYSYDDARTRDLILVGPQAGRLAGGDAASAFDLGGNFPRFLEFNRWMAIQWASPMATDIREMIYTPDGVRVHRLDRTGQQPASGDDSHLTHTHFSFYRDSLGRRARLDNFLGLLMEFFDPPATAGANIQEGIMRVGQLVKGQDVVITAPTVVGGGGWLNLSSAFGDARVRVGRYRGGQWSEQLLDVLDAGTHQPIHIDSGDQKITVQHLDGAGHLGVDLSPDRPY